MSCKIATLKCLNVAFSIAFCIFSVYVVFRETAALVLFSSATSMKFRSIAGIVVGSLFFLNSLFGCCGALRGSVRLIWIYAALLLVLMIAQIPLVFMPFDAEDSAVAIAGLVWRVRTEKPELYAQLEQEFNCCGKNGAEDYTESGVEVPASCYRDRNSTSSENLFAVGCVTALTKLFKHGAAVQVTGYWVQLGVEVSALVCACILAISLRNKKRRTRY